MIIDEDDYLEHYGTKRHSGRYPYGSGGDDPAGERNAFLRRDKELKKQGLSDPEIATAMGFGSVDRFTGEFKPSTGQLRARRTIAKAENDQARIATAQKLKDKGYSNSEIARQMGEKGESNIRALLAPGAKDKAEALTSVADMLQRHVDEKTYLDIGKGQEYYVGPGISQERLRAAVEILKAKGYVTHTVSVLQAGTGFETKTKVLAPPGTTWGDVRRNEKNIKSVQEFTDDGGRTFAKIHEPLSINPKRIDVVYKEDGGDKADGMIYVRPGVKDISLGGSPYGQVRIKVGNTHYLKGMAIYKDDLPDGVDLQFHTSKSKTSVKNKLDAMKALKDDPELPFGSVVRQIVEHPGTSKERVTSAMNLVGMKEGSGAEGSWELWSRNLSSQFLSKQSPALAKSQLNMTYERRKHELDDINAMTNPTVRKKLLEEYAKSTDSAAVHLKAAALPRQSTHVILPLDKISPSEVYAPGFKNGERVVLVRFPHAGIFELPELTVNNRNPQGKKLLKDARDAIGIHHTVAEHLSGADFDGDTVLVIPNNHGKVQTARPLEQLKNFDPKGAYPPYHGMKTIDGGIYNARTKTVEFGEKRPRSNKQSEMGSVSNLITDMTLKQASHEHIARAVKHSMVVIDAEKHNLDYKRSAIENGISALKAEYQGKARGGASTLISRKKQTLTINERKPRGAKEGGPIDKVTGARVFVDKGTTRLDEHGNRVPKTMRVKKLDLTDDAESLMSDAGTPMERLYAGHSNKLKGLANQARLASINTPTLKTSASAKQHYSKEAASLKSKLALAERNAPRERVAQRLANASVKARRELNPNLEADTIRKLRYQELEKARIRTGAGKQKIKITQEEWDAIQAGAISNHMLSRILNNADMDVVRTLASPPVKLLMTANKTARAREMLGSGYTRAEVAEALGVSKTTLDTAMDA